MGDGGRSLLRIFKGVEMTTKAVLTPAQVHSLVPLYFDDARSAHVYCGTSEWTISPLYITPQPADPAVKDSLIVAEEEPQNPRGGHA